MPGNLRRRSERKSSSTLPNQTAHTLLSSMYLKTCRQRGMGINSDTSSAIPITLSSVSRESRHTERKVAKEGLPSWPFSPPNIAVGVDPIWCGGPKPDGVLTRLTRLKEEGVQFTSQLILLWYLREVRGTAQIGLLAKNRSLTLLSTAPVRVS